MALLTFRDAVRSFAPWWATRELSRMGKLLYAIGAQLDAMMDAHVAAIKIGYPGLYSYESLPVLGRDRRVRRGPNETSSAYADRLRPFWDHHKGRGGPYAMLEQARAYFLPVSFQVDLVYRSGRRFVLDLAGAVARSDITWTPDSDARWARWWLFYKWPTAVSGEGLWGTAGTYGDGGVWGSTLTVTEVADIRAVPREWNAAHCFGRVVLLTGGKELWGYPAGTWGEAGGFWGSPAQLGIS